jgi:hypothetical protein
MTRLVRAGWLVAILLAMAHIAVAEDAMPITQALTVRPAPSATIMAGRGEAVPIRISITPPLHVQANPTAAGLIPLTVKFVSSNGISFGRPLYPKGTVLRLSGMAEFVNVYAGELAVMLPVRVTSAVKPGTYIYKGTVTSQACDEAVCFPPVSLPVSITIYVLKKDVTPVAASRTGA